MAAANLGERVALEYAARVALVDRCAKLRQLFLVTLRVAELERIDARTNYVRDATGATSGDLCFSKANDFFRKVDVAHGVSVRNSDNLPRKRSSNN